MFFADAHCDFLTKAANGADISQPADGQHISIDSLNNSNIRFLAFAAFGCAVEGFSENKAFTEKQINYYRKLTNTDARIGKIPQTATYCGLAFEGLDYVKSIDDLDFILRQNPVYAGIVWNYRNALGGSCHNDAHLSVLGKNAVKLLDAQGVCVDLAHAGKSTFYDAFDVVKQPFVSHGNVYECHNHPRNFNKEQIKLLIERHCFIGLTFYTEFIGADASVSQLFRHIHTILDMGGENILGFGSDLDGCSTLVNNAKDAAVYNLILEEMLRQNYSEETINKIAHQNLLRYLKITL